MGGQSFDENTFGQAPADAQSGIADLANEGGLTTEQPDLLFLAQANFTKTTPDADITPLPVG